MRGLSFISMVLVFVMFITGCSQASLMKTFASPEDEQAAKHYVDLLQAGKVDQIENDMDSSLKASTSNIHQTLLDMAGYMPALPPLSSKLVGSNIFSGGGTRRTSLTFEYQYPDRWLLVNVVIQKQDDVSTLIGFHIKRLQDSLETINRFGLADKSALQYAVLLGALAASLFSLYALILCIRTKMRGRKWLWIIFILLGVCSVSVNWTTGDWDFHLVYVQLLSGGASAPLYGAWVISVSLPLGAIWFVLQRKSLAAPIEQV